MEPPLKIRVEHGPEPGNLAEMKRQSEAALRNKLIFSADVDLVPMGALPHYEMQARLLHKAYAG